MGLAEENARYFDSIASQYNEKYWHKKLHSQLTKALRDHREWIGVDWITDEDRSSNRREVRLLDYACGTGFITRALGPYVTSVKGVDVSTNMVAAYNKAFEESAGPDNFLTPASAVVGNLLSDPPSPELKGPEYHGFDLAAVGLGFHHFEDAREAAKRLAERLKPGGVLFIVDFLHHAIDDVVGDAGEAHAHDSRHGHHHDGHHSHDSDLKDVGGLEDVLEEAKHSIKVLSFGEDDVKNDFEAAGLVDWKISVLPEKAEIEMKGKHEERTVFFARARRPAENEPSL